MLSSTSFNLLPVLFLLSGVMHIFANTAPGNDCKPGDSWKEDCNDCFCSDQGHAICTEMACAPQMSRSLSARDGFHCEPGTTWMDDCNTCFCSPSSQAACTLMACPPSSSGTGEECARAAAGFQFMRDCNSCVCNAHGQAVCTKLACGSLLLWYTELMKIKGTYCGCIHSGVRRWRALRLVVVIKYTRYTESGLVYLIGVCVRADTRHTGGDMCIKNRFLCLCTETTSWRSKA